MYLHCAVSRPLLIAMMGDFLIRIRSLHLSVIERYLVLRDLHCGLVHIARDISTGLEIK